MESIREIYKIGKGPASSHTMGPEKACKSFLSEYPTADRFSVTLYGSLAATGKGHLTDTAILEALGNTTTLSWEPDTVLREHPNALTITGYQGTSPVAEEWLRPSVSIEYTLEGPTSTDIDRSFRSFNTKTQMTSDA